jgi:hypothetical protein
VMKGLMESTAPRIVLRTDVTCVTMWTDPARVYLDGPDHLTAGIVRIELISTCKHIYLIFKTARR